MTQAQPLSARDHPDLQYNEALAAKRMKGMGYLGRSQSLTGPKCSSKQPCPRSTTGCVSRRWSIAWSRSLRRSSIRAALGVYNRSLLALAQHYGFHPRACRPYRAKTKGKVERPFSYIRQDFFLARSFRNLEDLNSQLQDWLDTVANVRLHATTQRIVSEAFAAEQLDLQRLPDTPFDALLKLER